MAKAKHIANQGDLYEEPEAGLVLAELLLKEGEAEKAARQTRLAVKKQTASRRTLRSTMRRATRRDSTMGGVSRSALQSHVTQMRRSVANLRDAEEVTLGLGPRAGGELRDAWSLGAAPLAASPRLLPPRNFYAMAAAARFPADDPRPGPRGRPSCGHGISTSPQRRRPDSPRTIRVPGRGVAVIHPSCGHGISTS